MVWKLGLGVATLLLLTIAAVVFALISAKGPRGAERIKAAIPWPGSCGAVTVQRPSQAPIMNRWSSSTTSTADIRCGRRGPGVAYAQFADGTSLDRAIAAHQPSQRYCLLSSAVVIDQLGAADPSVFTTMCQSLSGTFVNNVP